MFLVFKWFYLFLVCVILIVAYISKCIDIEELLKFNVLIYLCNCVKIICYLLLDQSICDVMLFVMLHSFILFICKCVGILCNCKAVLRPIVRIKLLKLICCNLAQKL